MAKKFYIDLIEIRVITKHKCDISLFISFRRDNIRNPLLYILRLGKIKISFRMEGIEQQLLDKGFNQRTLERMLRLQYELLKLDEADFEQGRERLSRFLMMSGSWKPPPSPSPSPCPFP